MRKCTIIFNSMAILSAPRNNLCNFERGSFVLFMYCVCHAFASVHCCLVVTCCERADRLALVCDVYCDFDTFSIGILGLVLYLIVSFPDPCCLFYFYEDHVSEIILNSWQVV